MRLFAIVLLVCCAWLCQSQDFTLFQTPFSRYTVNPDSCIRIEHSSGSLIFIEANAIQTTAKQVEILYREFLTPLDMLVAGIRMHVQIAGKNYPLESSGMFEIYAADGDQRLTFDPNKRMEIRLNGPTEIKPGTEGFKYDPSEQLWESYTSKIDNRVVVNDADLWGSTVLRQDAIVQQDDSFFSTADTVRQQVFQSMEISEFGFFNYDRILEGVEYVYLTPTFVSNKKEAITSTIYVVYSDINSVFYFPDYTWQEQFFLIKDKNYRLFTVASDGKVLRLESFPKLETLQSKTHTFTLNAQSTVPKDRAALSTLTGIQ